MASSGLIGMAGGIGGEMVKQADEERKLIANKDFETWRLGVLNEMKAQDDIRTDARADQRRMDRVARVDSAKQGLVSDAMGAKYAGSDAAVAAADAGQTDAPLSAEQKAVISQAKGTDRTAMMNDPMTSVQASVKTGDLLPHDAAVLALGEKRADREERKMDINERTTLSKERQVEMRDATQRYIADLRHQDSQKRLDALIAKTGAGKDKDGVKEALSVIDGARKDLANEATNLKSLYATELKDKSKAEQARIQAEYKPKFDAIDAQRGQLDEDYDSLRGKVGLPARKKPEDAKAEPAAKDAPLPLPKQKSGLVTGKTYSTARGPAKWNGTAFEAR
jgi:hypothetical protein